MQKLARAAKVACAAVALAVLAVSPATFAQTAPRRTRQQNRSPAPAKAPAAALTPLPPIVPVAPAPIVGPRASDEGPRIAGLVGLEAPLGKNADSSVKVQLEAATELQRIGPRARLEGVLSLGFVPYSKNETVAGISTELQSNTFELVPAFRFAFALGSKLTFEGDTGIGVAYVTTKSTAGSITTTEDRWGEMLRFAAGFSIDVNDKLRLGARAGLDVFFYETTSKAVPLLFEASWRM